MLPEGVRRVRGDRRRNLAGFADEFRRYAPDVVLDMISMNEREARDVVSVFEGIARRVVAVSSGDVYRAYDRVTGSGPTRRRRAAAGKFYPHASEGDEQYEKILVEEVVMGPGLPGTVLRLPAVYGSGDYQHRLFRYLKRMDDGRPAILLGEGMAS